MSFKFQVSTRVFVHVSITSGRPSVVSSSLGSSLAGFKSQKYVVSSSHNKNLHSSSEPSWSVSPRRERKNSLVAVGGEELQAGKFKWSSNDTRNPSSVTHDIDFPILIIVDHHHPFEYRAIQIHIPYLKGIPQEWLKHYREFPEIAANNGSDTYGIFRLIFLCFFLLMRHQANQARNLADQ